MRFVVGITGSIAVGKSSVTNYLRSKGYKVVDADEITHRSYQKGTKCYYQIIENFDCLDQNEEIDRKCLGNIIFSHQEKKKLLESIVHPYVIECIQKEINQSSGLIFLDIPLLYEISLESLCDKIIVVYVDEKTQLKRLMERNHILEKEAQKLINSQISIEIKKLLADYVIDNRFSFDKLYQNIDRELEVIKNEAVFK